MRKKIDVLCVGELLVDMIGQQINQDLFNTQTYHRYLGGSPTNVAINLSKLSLNSAIVASCGTDGLGLFCLDELQKVGVDISYVKKKEYTPTSIILVSSSEETPDFIPFRTADFDITKDQITKSSLGQIGIFHTTCFALSKEPARSTIVEKAAEAYEAGCKLSIDVNYSQKIWQDQNEAKDIIQKYCSYNPLVKISDDDMQRLFGVVLADEEIFNFFHDSGAEVVCLTKGSKGVVLSNKGEISMQSAQKIKTVKDTTGAGDAFWSGFLFAYLQGKNVDSCATSGLKLAAIKIQNIGGLPDKVDLAKAIL